VIDYLWRRICFVRTRRIIHDVLGCGWAPSSAELTICTKLLTSVDCVRSSNLSILNFFQHFRCNFVKSMVEDGLLVFLRTSRCSLRAHPLPVTSLDILLEVPIFEHLFPFPLSAFHISKRSTVGMDEIRCLETMQSFNLSHSLIQRLSFQNIYSKHVRFDACTLPILVAWSFPFRRDRGRTVASHVGW
jgi:hypothetical protein